jgi:cysteine desulfurase
MAGSPVYLDNMATTPMDPRVLEAMLPFFTEQFGNPASKTHQFGWAAAEAIEAARSSVADLVGASRPREIVFTSGTTESNNLALKGAAEQLRQRGTKIVTCDTEHASVLNCLRQLEGQGFEVVYLPVDESGIVDMERLAEEIETEPILVSIMAANNETGTVQRLKEIGVLAKRRGVIWHCDAAQAVGKIPFSAVDIGADLVSFSAHKIYGPKGVGALYVRSRDPRVRLVPQIAGGGHERGIRSGTLNVPGNIGFGEACRLLHTEREAGARTVKQLRQRLLKGLGEQIESIRLNGHPTRCIPGCVNLEIGGVDSAELIPAMKQVAVASAAACSSGANEPSHVLKAMGRSDRAASSSLRIGIGRFNTPDDIDLAVSCIARRAEQMREAGTGGAGETCRNETLEPAS